MNISENLTSPSTGSPLPAEKTTTTLEINATRPGTIKVIKRNGKMVVYDDSKIANALTMAFMDEKNINYAPASSHMREITGKLTASISETFRKRMPSGGSLHIEEIQDQVELELMRNGHHKVARSYVLYREERRLLREQNRQQEQEQTATPEEPVTTITGPDGNPLPLNQGTLRNYIQEACHQLEYTDAEVVLKNTLPNIYEGMDYKELYPTLIQAVRTLMEREANYSYVAARLLLRQLREEVYRFFEFEAADTDYTALFPDIIAKGVELELLNRSLLEKFDLDTLAGAIKPERDLQFSFLGLQILYDRYLIHTDNQQHLELPQTFFMRVAMGLAVNEDDPNRRAIEFYEVLSKFDYMCSTPTLFNSGTLHPQLSSCYLSTVNDDLSGIFSAVHNNALLSKWAGGLGNDWTPVRALGSHIKGTNGKSQGIVPFLKVVNDTTIAVNQGGKRKGALCCYLESWHLDIEEFLELRKNTGDDRRRTHDMHTANWIPDLFMKRLAEDGDWTLFSPDEVPELHDACGKRFEQLYTDYEAKAERGELRLSRKIKAATLWRQMITMLFETGHPWITFKDSCNIRSPQQHQGTIHSSNLCTEITLNTSQDEIAVCNLGSINLVNHITEDNQLDQEKLRTTIKSAMRMLDNVIDINYYAVDEARHSNMLHRPVGLGMMGFQDALYKMHIPYQSQEAVEFADRSTELISYYAIENSAELAAERGRYSSYEGSLWSQGILPVDSIELLSRERGEEYLSIDRSTTLDWDTLRTRVLEQGMRNSNVMAIAPTATISNICGISQSIEPGFSNLYTKSNLSGEFTVINQYMLRDLQQLDLWDPLMIQDLKYFNGKLENIDRVPENIKNLYATAFDIDQQYLVEAASRRQKWLDQSQSLNLYIGHTSGLQLSELYRSAWKMGLKTTYYMRTLGATEVEKSTIDRSSLNAISTQSAVNGNGAAVPAHAQPDQEAPPANGNGSAHSYQTAVAEDQPPAVCQLGDEDCEACQ